MTFDPIGHTELEYCLGFPSSNDESQLTLRWKQRNIEVKLNCPLVENKSEPTSYMFSHYHYGAKDADELMAIPLSSSVIAYADLGDLPDASTVALVRKIIGYIQLTSELEPWIAASPSEEENRMEASKRIIDCFNNASDHLGLNNLGLSSLPESIGRIRTLRVLNLSENRLTSLPESIGQLEALTELDLAHNELTSLPESIGELGALTDLNLARNELYSLPRSFGQLRALTKLNLFKNHLNLLPENFGQLGALIDLNLSCNDLSSLPDNMRQLTVLTKLELAFNSFFDLPNSIGQLRALTELVLAGNRLSSLPDSIGQLRALITLNLSDNQLPSLPNSIGQLRALTELVLAGNRLSSLPDSIGQLSALITLNLSDNQLPSLPENFGELRALRRLNLRHNQLTIIPENFGELRALEDLNLSANQLSSLPENFNELIALRRLDIRHNRLTIIPENLQEHMALNLMSDIFQNNPLAIDHDELLSIRLLLGMLSKLIGENAPQFNQAFLEVGEHPAKLWLINLWATSDFTSGSTETKKRLAEVVLNAFKYASEHEDFQEWFSLFLDTANISCVDRTALSLIDLEILIESKRLSTIQDPLVARAFLKNAWATYLLHQLAKETMKERPGLDELDVHLAYLIGCKKPLEKLGIQLPFSSEKMMFFEITNLTKDDLSGAVQRVQEKMNSPKTLQDFVEFLSLEDDVVAKFCLTLFKNLFAEEIENVTKAAEERQGLVEDFIGAINEDELNPKSVQDSSLPSEIKSLLLKKPFRDVDQEQVYEELNKLNKDPYLLLAAKYIFNVQAT